MMKCILIYDDDPDILQVSKLILERENYKVATRMLCDKIIKDIAKVKPDVVLMDYWIPEMGGEKAIQLMKCNKQTKDLPVILFSSNNKIEEICERVHADGFIKKPFDISHFLSMVAKSFAMLELVCMF